MDRETVAKKYNQQEGGIDTLEGVEDLCLRLEAENAQLKEQVRLLEIDALDRDEVNRGLREGSRMTHATRKRRESLGLSQAKVARLAEMPQSALCDIELGRRMPWPKARRALARALRVTEAELFPPEGSEQ